MIETYHEAVIRIKNAVLLSRYKSAANVNAGQLTLYYSIGAYISTNTRSGKWGTGAIDAISAQLQAELPGLRGFSSTNMKSMRLFYEEWAVLIDGGRQLSTADSIDKSAGLEIRQLSTAEFGSDAEYPTIYHLLNGRFEPNYREAFMRIGFTHHREIIAKCKEPGERWYYILRCAAEFWTVDALKSHIRANDYHHLGKLSNNFELAIPDEKTAAKAVFSFKDEYLLDYINIEDETDPELIDERVLSKKIVENITKFIMSMGNGFTFIARNFRLIVDEEEFFCDLLLYSRDLRCLVAIELKMGRFKPAYLGQLSFYLSVLDEMEKRAEENNSIGLLLCKEANAATVELAIQDYNKPMGVATYKTANDIPEPYRALAPLIEGVKEIVAGGEEA
jgi:predicted nuclease of restriction endonuclease-like (RecB) superfamily